MGRRSFALVLLAGLLAGCPPVRTPPPRGPVECPRWGCGSNTPIVAGSPFEALHLGGRANPDGIRLIPGSLHGGPCGASAMLDVRGGELVGLDPGGRIVCGGLGLAGAKFRLEVATPDGRHRRVTIRIAEVGRVHPWTVLLGALRPLPTYLLVEEQTRAPICYRSEPWMEAWQETSQVADPAGVWHKPTHHALVVRGETYHGSDATVELSGRVGASWFNIACAGTAIAKLRLLGHDPADASSSRAERQATLKMLTARYCGTDSFTERGMPVLWKSERGTQFHGTPDPRSVGHIESRWNEHGAVCLSHVRAWRAGHKIPAALTGYCSTTGSRRPSCETETQLIEEIRKLCELPDCTGSEPALWSTHTVDHIAH